MLLPQLGIKRNVLSAGFLYYFAISVLFDFETAKIVVKEDVLLAQPLHDFCVALATASVSLFQPLQLVALLELNDKITDFGRIIVTMDQHLLIRNTFKFFVVVAQVIE